MEKRLKIYTFSDKNPEFLQLQIDSYKKHMNDGNTDFIVINASNNNINNDEIITICGKNNIEMIPYNGIRVDFPKYVVEQYAWFRETIQKNSTDFILLIHSDMFFINNLDYKKLMSLKKIYFNPQYRDTPFYKVHDGTFNYFYMWDGIILFDNEYINQNNLRQHFDWDFIYGITDVGGNTNNLIKNINPNDLDYFEMWTHHEISGNILHSGLNGGIHFTINLNDENKKIREGIQMGNKSFPYEIDQSNYETYVIEKILKIKELFINPYEFENPVDSDWIQVLNEPIETAPILHFKSGSQLYNKNKFHKLEQIRKIVFRDEI
jgi:hypothetical protein